MPKTPIPADEAERLREMEELGVLDPALGPKLHSIAVLAARICRMPVALVNLVGGERQYFQGRVGMDLSGVDRDSGFCPYVVDAGAPLEIHDALADPRVREDALVTGEPHVRYYVGAPLLSSRGHTLGTVCLFDHRPRRLTSEQREVLLSLAANATMLLEAHGRAEERDRFTQGLRELQELKEQFLRTVNHELRTPMTSIRSYLRLLKEGGLDEATEHRFLEVVERNRARLLDLLDDLLLLASLNAGSLGFSPGPADLAGLTSQAVGDVIDDARSKGHTLNLHAPAGAEVWVDAGRLRQALRHLLDNAVKFTLPGGTIDVVVTAEPAPTLEIRDTGIAVEAEALKHVFEDFYRAPNAEEQAIAGLGIGLSITDKIVRWHGGDVAVENQAGGGIRIVLTLPRAASAQRSGPS
ncbi:GAF domain-containing sensor histidine kinase [Planomonospora venezuelensis]|uniref:histidine kinase n=1 Tax=Planomonospora venezuelensis TaxID=1999 RepID=A0A841CZU9_PLAVE|nr:HAMP domain-containing sensor histidine kinase [Planomonospora venezuelensis]MBB5962313.1 signal transduction histidine kinase [Planomonospora venezuelensis]GIN00693.1 sensor histidine kinase [Planomonospora venezuelensis]